MSVSNATGGGGAGAGAVGQYHRGAGEGGPKHSSSERLRDTPRRKLVTIGDCAYLLGAF